MTSFNDKSKFKVRRENPKSWKKCLAKASNGHNDDVDNDAWELKPETTFVKNNEELTVVEPHELIESYKYGSELITVQGNFRFFDVWYCFFIKNELINVVALHMS